MVIPCVLCETGNTRLMRPKRTETAFHTCIWPGEMVVRMRGVLATPGWCNGVQQQQQHLYSQCLGNKSRGIQDKTSTE